MKRFRSVFDATDDSDDEATSSPLAVRLVTDARGTHADAPSTPLSVFTAYLEGLLSTAPMGDADATDRFAKLTAVIDANTELAREACVHFSDRLFYAAGRGTTNRIIEELMAMSTKHGVRNPEQCLLYLVRGLFASKSRKGTKYAYHLSDRAVPTSFLGDSGSWSRVHKEIVLCALLFTDETTNGIKGDKAVAKDSKAARKTMQDKQERLREAHAEGVARERLRIGKMHPRHAPAEKLAALEKEVLEFDARAAADYAAFDAPFAVHDRFAVLRDEEFIAFVKRDPNLLARALVDVRDPDLASYARRRAFLIDAVPLLITQHDVDRVLLRGTYGAELIAMIANTGHTAANEDELWKHVMASVLVDRRALLHKTTHALLPAYHVMTEMNAYLILRAMYGRNVNFGALMTRVEREAWYAWAVNSCAMPLLKRIFGDDDAPRIRVDIVPALTMRVDTRTLVEDDAASIVRRDKLVAWPWGQVEPAIDADASDQAVVLHHLPLEYWHALVDKASPSDLRARLPGMIRTLVGEPSIYANGPHTEDEPVRFLTMAYFNLDADADVDDTAQWADIIPYLRSHEMELLLAKLVAAPGCGRRMQQLQRAYVATLDRLMQEHDERASFVLRRLPWAALINATKLLLAIDAVAPMPSDIRTALTECYDRCREPALYVILGKLRAPDDDHDDDAD